MTIDHIGYLFFPDQLVWRLVGRIAFPLFAFGAAEGACHTRNRKRYLLRLLLWAALSEIPFDLMGAGSVWSLDNQNVLWTLAAGVACCWLWERHRTGDVALVVGLMVASTLLMTDYMFPGVLAVMLIYFYTGKGQRVRGVAWACAVLTLFIGGPVQLPCMLAVALLYFYNGKPGRRTGQLFHAYYPIHQLVLWAIFSFVAGGAIA